jgi:hypothetical protein
MPQPVSGQCFFRRSQTSVIRTDEAVGGDIFQNPALGAPCNRQHVTTAYLNDGTVDSRAPSLRFDCWQLLLAGFNSISIALMWVSAKFSSEPVCGGLHITFPAWHVTCFGLPRDRAQFAHIRQIHDKPNRMRMHGNFLVSRMIPTMWPG